MHSFSSSIGWTLKSRLKITHLPRYHHRDQQSGPFLRLSKNKWWKGREIHGGGGVAVWLSHWTRRCGFESRFTQGPPSSPFPHPLPAPPPHPVCLASGQWAVLSSGSNETKFSDPACAQQRTHVSAIKRPGKILQKFQRRQGFIQLGDAASSRFFFLQRKAILISL